jgi:hypothetical protein
MEESRTVVTGGTLAVALRCDAPIVPVQVAGIVTVNELIVVHGDGALDKHGTKTCTSCTIGGRTGSFTATFVFHGSGGQFT